MAPSLRPTVLLKSWSIRQSLFLSIDQRLRFKLSTFEQKGFQEERQVDGLLAGTRLLSFRSGFDIVGQIVKSFGLTPYGCWPIGL